MASVRSFDRSGVCGHRRNTLVALLNVFQERLGRRSHPGFSRFYGSNGAVYRVQIGTQVFAMKIVYCYEDQLRSADIESRYEQEVKLLLGGIRLPYHLSRL
jgi:hypothetical protein